MPRLIAKALLNAKSKTMEEWNQAIKSSVQARQEQQRIYEEKKRQLLPQLIESNKAGVSTRELEQITGINHTTIARWIKEAKEKQNVKPS
jgi:DNA invertase Pin-like site-specific DNA recombinase